MSRNYKKITVYHERDHMFKKNYPRDEDQIPVSCKEMIGAYTAVKKSFDCYQFHIHDTDDHVVISEHDQSSILLHIHIIERRCMNSHLSEYGEVVDGIKLLCIFTDNILEISLERSFFDHLGAEKVGFSLEGFRTDFSFCTTHTELLSFTINENDRNESLRACSVLGAQVELFQLDFIVNDDGRLFNEITKAVFILPPTIRVIKIYCDSNFITLRLKIKSTQFQFQIYIYDGKSNELDDKADPIFILSHFEKRNILAKSDQLERFQLIGFQIVATMYVSSFEDDKDLPEIREFIKALFVEIEQLCPKS